MYISKSTYGLKFFFVYFWWMDCTTAAGQCCWRTSSSHRSKMQGKGGSIWRKQVWMHTKAARWRDSCRWYAIWWKMHYAFSLKLCCGNTPISSKDILALYVWRSYPPMKSSPNGPQIFLHQYVHHSWAPRSWVQVNCHHHWVKWIKARNCNEEVWFKELEVLVRVLCSS